jgi:hypothetical protein
MSASNNAVAALLCYCLARVAHCQSMTVTLVHVETLETSATPSGLLGSVVLDVPVLSLSRHRRLG